MSYNRVKFQESAVFYNIDKNNEIDTISRIKKNSLSKEKYKDEDSMT